ncbi:MAG: spore germination protein [Clostridiales bacterium]|nr:spore germination protein [Clostridiales bacterium]
MELYDNLDDNIAEIEKTLDGCGDVVSRRMAAGDSEIYVLYIDLLADADMVREMTTLAYFSDGREPLAFGVRSPDVREAADFDSIYDAIMGGETALLTQGSNRATLVSTRKWPNRGVGQAEAEVVVEGPKDAFTESFRYNTALIRRRIRDKRLKCRQTVVGRRGKANVGLMYIADLVRPEVLKELNERLAAIDTDAVLDVGYLEAMLSDDWLSPLPLNQLTERPDKAASAILEGRVAVVCDNSPFVMLAPSTAHTFFQAADDYSESWQTASFLRVLRYAAAVIAVCFPGLYCALSAFHPAMIPTRLALKMAETRAHVPFPIAVELIMMELAFELLREAGLRLPGPVGGAIGVVGGIIVGQAAVEAGIVCPMVVIVVALTAIAGFAIPSYAMGEGLRPMKYFIIILSAALGLFGFWCGVILCLAHMASLKSFGTPYLFPFVSGEVNGFSDVKDTIVRAPLRFMRRRPIFARRGQQKRM